jgi:hypothetical protein
MARRQSRKERITVSLSGESIRFLKAFRAEIHSPSMSALFEKIVSDVKGRTEMEQLDDNIKAYYDSLPETSVQEDRAWGSLGEAALVSLAEEERGEERPQLASVGR